MPFGRKTSGRLTFGQCCTEERLVDLLTLDQIDQILRRPNVCRANGFRSKDVEPIGAIE